MKTQLILFAILSLITVTPAVSQEIAGNLSQTIAPKLPETITPSFAGGDEALALYLQEKIKYPYQARKQGIEGTVVLQYHIEADGSIKNIMVVKSVNAELDRKAIRVAKKMPRWNPCMNNGQPVRIAYQLPITFTLTD